MTIIPKFDGGGAALPFVDYMPMGAGATAEVPGSDVGATTTSKAAKSGDDDSIGLKDLLKLASLVDGLPSDIGKVTEAVRNIYKEASLFNDGEMSTDALVTTYLSALLKIKVAGFNKEQFKEARDQVTANGGLHEIAIREDGRVFVQDTETGKATWATLEEYNKLKEKHPEKYEALTNSNLLYYRAEHPSFSFKNDVLTTVSNGIGWKKVTEMLQLAAAHVGSEEVKKEGYSYLSQLKIQAGLAQMLLAAASGMPIAGLYKHGSSSKSNLSEIQLAMNYLWHTMPTNAKTWLKYRGGGSEEGAKQIMAELLFSQTQSQEQQTISYAGDPEWQKQMQLEHLNLLKLALAMRAQKEKEKKEEEDKSKIGFVSSVLAGLNGREATAHFNLGGEYANTGMDITGTAYGMAMTPSGQPITDTSLFKMLSDSHLMGIANQQQGIYFGEKRVTNEDLKNIAYTGSELLRVNVPVNSDGTPNFLLLQHFTEFQNKIKLSGGNPLAVQSALADYPDVATLINFEDGTYNMSQFRPYLLVDGMTTDGLVDVNATETGTNLFVADVRPNPNLYAAIKESLTTGSGNDKKVPLIDEYSMSEAPFKGWGEWINGYDHIIKGAVYIPIDMNRGSADMYDNFKVSEQRSGDLNTEYLRRDDILNYDFEGNSSDLLGITYE